MAGDDIPSLTGRSADDVIVSVDDLDSVGCVAQLHPASGVEADDVSLDSVEVSPLSTQIDTAGVVSRNQVPGAGQWAAYRILPSVIDEYPVPTVAQVGSTGGVCADEVAFDRHSGRVDHDPVAAKPVYHQATNHDSGRYDPQTGAPTGGAAV